MRQGTPAARAGITAGDVIASINGQRAKSPADVAQALATLQPGQTVTEGISPQDGSRTSVRLMLAQHPWLPA